MGETERNKDEATPVIVVEVIDADTVAINRGKRDGIRAGERFLIYRRGSEIIDPLTKEDLGVLEIPLGTGSVVHVQEKIAIIKSDKKRRIEKQVDKTGGYEGLRFLIPPEIEYTTELVPFDYPEVGDLAKRV